jgi:hypothetical protein
MTLPSLSPAPAGAVFLRPEPDDGTFLSERALRSGITGLILRPRLLLELAGDSKERLGRLRRVRAVLAKPSTMWLLDPETSGLTAPAITEEDAAARLRQTAIAQSVELPLNLATLADPDVMQVLLEATWALQAGAAALTAPYFRITTGDELLIALNLELARRTALADERATMAVLEANVGALTSGSLTRIAARLRACGVDLVMLRVVGCKEDAPARHVASYLRLARELTAAGLEVICDQVGRLGPVLVAGAGAAFSTGSWHYRSVPYDLIPRKGGGGGSQPIPYELPGRWRSSSPALARNLPAARCSVGSCRALDPKAGPADQREHFLHTVVAAAEQARDNPIETILSSLTASGDATAAGWAAALREVQAESA